MTESSENKESNCECCEGTVSFGQRHIGKLGVVLGILGATTSVLVSLKIIVASGLVLGLTNFGIIVGAVCYENLHSQNKELKSSNQTLQEENISLSQSLSRGQELDTPRSIGSIEPVNFSSIHLNNTAPPSPNNEKINM